MGHRAPNLEMSRLSTGWLVRRMPQRIGWEMVGLWNVWKNDVSIMREMIITVLHQNRKMEEGISESCDGDLHTIL